MKTSIKPDDATGLGTRSAHLLGARFRWNKIPVALLSTGIISLVGIIIGVNWMPPFSSRFVLYEGMNSVGRPATADQLRAIEVMLGTELPIEYRQFLLEVNGIECDPSSLLAFSPYDRGYKVSMWRLLEGLYSVDQLVPKDTQSLEAKTADYFKKRVPDRFLIIGHGPYWDVVCISLSGNDRGAVYYWDDPRGTDEELIESGENPETERFLFPAGRDFREFWNSLHPPNRDEDGRVIAD